MGVLFLYAEIKVWFDGIGFEGDGSRERRGELNRACGVDYRFGRNLIDNRVWR